MKKIVLAGGCFWGLEEYYARMNGVINTEVGYANGKTTEPTYREVCDTDSGHAEVVQLEYDEKIISLSEILVALWKVIDPTLINRQGADIGDQYRTGIYYLDESDLAVIKDSVDAIANEYDLPIRTEVEALTYYFKAEEYHQRYLKKNPNGYCHIPLD